MSILFDSFMKESISYDDLKSQVLLIHETGDYEGSGFNEKEIELLRKFGAGMIDDIINARIHKAEIIEKWKTFFRNEIAENHQKNTKKLVKLKEFNLNPFLDSYKANFLMGNNSPESIATALIYARSLGTSINTSFGTSLQKFCSNILSGFASTTSGIDIEFIDFVDGRKKYCQVKLGPNTINKDDVKTISDHFNAVRNLARTNHLDIGINDLIVGVFYGQNFELSTHYKNIMRNYPVYVGEEFWFRLTGDEEFYETLSNASNEIAAEYDGRELLREVIVKLAKKIEETTSSI